MTTDLNEDQAAAALHLSTVWEIGSVVSVRGARDVRMCVQAIRWSTHYHCAVVDCSYFDAHLHRQVECFKPQMLERVLS